MELSYGRDLSRRKTMKILKYGQVIIESDQTIITGFHFGEPENNDGMYIPASQKLALLWAIERLHQSLKEIENGPHSG